MSSKKGIDDNVLEEYEGIEFNKKFEEYKQKQEARYDLFRDKPVIKNNDNPKKKRNIGYRVASIGTACVMFFAAAGTAYNVFKGKEKQDNKPNKGISILVDFQNADKAISDAQNYINLYIEANIKNAHVNTIFRTGTEYMAEMQDNKTNSIYRVPINLTDEHKQALHLINELKQDINSDKGINRDNLDELRILIPKLNQILKDREEELKNNSQKNNNKEYTYEEKLTSLESLKKQGINTTLLEKKALEEENYEDEYERD